MSANVTIEGMATLLSLMINVSKTYGGFEISLYGISRAGEKSMLKI